MYRDATGRYNQLPCCLMYERAKDKTEKGFKSLKTLVLILAWSLYYLTAEAFEENPLISLNLSFFFCKMKFIMHAFHMLLVLIK